MHSVLANLLRTAETPSLAAHESSVSPKTVGEVPLNGLSLRCWPTTSRRANPRGPGVGTSSGSVISVFGGGPRKIRRPLQSEQLPASRARPAVARSRILHHEPKPGVGDEIPHA